MRTAGVLAAVIAVVALGLVPEAGEVLAKAQAPAVATGMNPRPDLAQLQSATWEWLRTSATSGLFISGLGAGVILGEAARFLVRWTVRALGLAAGLVNLVVRYRLLLASVIAAGYYIVAFRVLG